MTDVTMPLLSDAMEEGTILAWLIDDGDAVAIGDELVEIETDKATMTYTAEGEGVLQVVVPEGETVPVGQTIARLAGPEEAPAASRGSEPAVEDGDPEGDPPEEDEDGVSDSAPNESGSTEPITEPVALEENDRVPATPLARRAATVHGVSLASITGTGPNERITKADVLAEAGVVSSAPSRVLSAQTRAGVSDPSHQGQPAAKGASRVEDLTKLQSVIARRMAEAKATVPDFQVETEVVMDAAVGLRGQLKQIDDGRPAPSFNDMVVKACALALPRHPLANGSYVDRQFLLHERINIGIAVAAEGSLVVPTVTDADTRSLTSIAAETRQLAARVRSGEITPPELAGGTFTVSNLGMFGMTAITPVINLPQAAILGVGALRSLLARDESGEIVDRTLLTLRLTCDHRILYGAAAAVFLAEVKDLLEQPLSLLA